MTNVERARDFYRDVLGLELRVDVPQTYAEFVSEGVTIGLYRTDLMSQRVGERWVGGPGGAVLCVAVEDAARAFKTLVGRGAIPVADAHDEAAWSLRVAYVADPDGHVIELDQRLATAD